MQSEKSIIKTRRHTDCGARKSSAAALSCTFPPLQIFLFKRFLVTHDTTTPFVASVSGLLVSSGVFRNHSSLLYSQILFLYPPFLLQRRMWISHTATIVWPPWSPCPFFPFFHLSLFPSLSVFFDARCSYPQGQLCWQPAGEKVTDKT
ncbi:hypothetical protein L195_g011120 [Trifolium pratense]|uniref:Uncharacterized protein n=1 Tax=Trifolium pratense TaxID=57577 RepID=A0A2K3PEW9_TRIPR|nr:hypothetical protein L195_g010516 [Trifolium pratense]PNY14439.1 hypothetical protein L195_g011120 [Trifolium pratense]